MDRHLQRALDAIDAATHGLTPEQIARPVPGKWSVAQVLEHLALACSRGADAARAAVAAGQPTVTAPRLRQVVTRTMVVDVGYFPRVRAPRGVVPSTDPDPQAALAAAREGLADIDAALEAAAARFGEDTPLFDHPYFAGMSAAQWRRFHWRHTLHHVRQIRQRVGDAPTPTRSP